MKWEFTEGPLVPPRMDSTVIEQVQQNVFFFVYGLDTIITLGLIPLKTKHKWVRLGSIVAIDPIEYIENFFASLLTPLEATFFAYSWTPCLRRWETFTQNNC